MKKVILLLAMVVSVCAFAQTEQHMKFMGIELNGSIKAFQSKLETKGATVSPLSSKMPNGVRLFNGVFSGENAQIAVFYNPRSKEVYRAKAVIERFGKDKIEQLFENMESKLDLKYGNESKTSEVIEDDHLHSFKQVQYVVENGSINLYIVSSSYTSHSDFDLHIDYYDLENYASNLLEEMEDL